MKKLFFGMAVVAAATFGAYNANKTNANSQMSDLQMENVEILAEGEDNTKSYCYWDPYAGRCRHNGAEVCLLVSRTWFGCREY